MKISWNWLNDWVSLEGLSVAEVAARLTMAGLEVEAIEHLGEGTERIVIGRIDAIEKHPKADRLVVCSVDTGDGKPRQIVCGATNMVAGDVVPVALPGSQPPALDFEIVERKVMGVMSQGMLCSEEELGLSRESEGLWILPRDLSPGEPVFEALGLKDTVIHIGLTPNRADCLSHLGVAREVAALFGRSLRPERRELPAALWDNSSAGPIDDVASLTIENPQGCPHYTLAVLEDVTVGPSPLWLRRRLLSVGMRAINNLVDVTNFVMMDVGQPLHAFDLDKLKGASIVVRQARAGEKIVGIDHREYELSDEDLVIADAERPVAIAGVMGGVDTEVTDETRRILVECAYFDPATVRRSARRHGLHTESSHRFERGIDVGAVEANLQRAVHWFTRAHEDEQRAPNIRSGMVGVKAEGFARPVQISLHKSHVKRLLGIEPSVEQVVDYLETLGMSVEEQGDTLAVTIPTWRHGDLERAVDLVEEVARMHGYDNLPSRLPRSSMGHVHRRRESDQAPTIVSRQTRSLLRWMRSTLLAHGLREVVNYSFMSPDDLSMLGIGGDDCRADAATIANPLVKTQGLMRTTLIPSLLANLRTNIAHRTEDVALFELGRRYLRSGEQRTLSFLLTGEVLPHWSKSRTWDFYDAKGLVEALAAPFDIASPRWQPGEVLEPYLHPGVQAMWTSEGRALATVGQLHPRIAQEEEFEQPVYLAEIYVDTLLDLPVRTPRYKPLPKFPAVRRDFALIHDRYAQYGAIEDAVAELARTEPQFGAILESVELFDLYQGEQIPADKRSLALTVVYRSVERTLTDQEIEQADRLLLEAIRSRTGAHLR